MRRTERGYRYLVSLEASVCFGMLTGTPVIPLFLWDLTLSNCLSPGPIVGNPPGLALALQLRQVGKAGKLPVIISGEALLRAWQNFLVDLRPLEAPGHCLLNSLSSGTDGLHQPLSEGRGCHSTESLESSPEAWPSWPSPAGNYLV